MIYALFQIFKIPMFLTLCYAMYYFFNIDDGSRAAQDSYFFSCFSVTLLILGLTFKSLRGKSRGEILKREIEK